MPHTSLCVTRRAGFALFVILGLALPGCRRAAVPPPNTTNVSAAPVAPASPPALVPLPAGGVKGIYMTGWTAGHQRRFNELVSMIDRTELNAVVIDIKDNGLVSYDVNIPLVIQAKASRRMMKVGRVMETLNKHHIFPIARIACFRDTVLPMVRPDLAVLDSKGKVWKDHSGHTWLNPFLKETWDYNVDIALDALRQGFKEIQFDYVRFPSEGNISSLRYPGRPPKGLRREQIEAFVQYAREKIKAQGAWFSADVFGLTSLVKSDMGIGQTSTNVAQHVDYLCPMVYPSHYAKGEYGIKDPNREPYRVVYASLKDAKEHLKDIPTCKLRPWLQDFSLYGVTYGAAQVKAQITAARKLGIQEFLLWNAGCRYTQSALAKKPTAPSAPPKPRL